jgi:hypothetical protein
MPWVLALRLHRLGAGLTWFSMAWHGMKHLPAARRVDCGICSVSDLCLVCVCP